MGRIYSVTRMIRLVPIAATAILATACAASLDATRDPYLDDTSAPDVGDALTITAITPNYGSIHGGDDITVQVANLQGTAEIFFGNANLDVTKLDATTFVVTTPNAGAPLSVDVIVRGDNGEDVWPSGFTFSDSGPPPDTGGTGGTGGPGPTGNVGGFIEFSRTQVACPSCLGFPAEFSVQAGAAFHAPISGSWNDWLPPVGQCAVDPDTTPPTGSYIDAGSIAYLKSGSTTIALTNSGTASYLAEGLPLNDYISNGSYTLEVPSPGGSLGAFTQANAVVAAEGFDSITPFELLYGGEAGAFTAQVSSVGQTFTWSPAGSGDAFVIDLGAYDYYSGAYIGKVVCHGADTGSMYIPTSNFMDAPLLLTVGMYRRKYTYTTNPATGDTIEAVATAGYLGTAAMEF